MCLCLNPQTYKHVILDGKRDFADVNKLRILRLGNNIISIRVSEEVIEKRIKDSNQV